MWPTMGHFGIPSMEKPPKHVGQCAHPHGFSQQELQVKENLPDIKNIYIYYVYAYLLIELMDTNCCNNFLQWKEWAASLSDSSLT